jgi:putative transposase
VDDQRDRHSVHLIVSHLIWCPKRRRRVLVGPVQKRLEQIIAGVITENSWQLIERALQPDHVHLFVRINPSTLPSDIPRLIKGRSSRLLRQDYLRQGEKGIGFGDEQQIYTLITIFEAQSNGREHAH